MKGLSDALTVKKKEKKSSAKLLSRVAETVGIALLATFYIEEKWLSVLYGAF